MDEEQRTRQARDDLEHEVERQASPPGRTPDQVGPGPAERPVRPAWVSVGLVAALPVLGFFIARLPGLLIGVALALLVLAVLRFGRKEP